MKFIFFKLFSTGMDKLHLLQFRIIILVIIMAPSLIHAEETKDYRHILMLGINKPVSNSEDNAPLPVFGYSYTRDDFNNGFYLQVAVRSTSAGIILAKKTERYFTGIKPLVNHTIYGAYHSFKEGVNDGTRCFRGNNSGADFFYQYFLLKNLGIMIDYYPGYYWYLKKKKGNYSFIGKDETLINLPENHIEHAAGLDITFGSVEKKDLERIKSGFFIEGIYRFSLRSGYGTFYDTETGENSSINKTHKRYLSAGLYYNTKSNINFLLDAYGAWHINTDRNNADQIGSYVADYGIIPGYYWGEFYHNRYYVTRVQAGLPLFFSDARIQPGFNILYLARDNDVIAAGNYPRKVYRSFSAELSFSAGGVLPFFLDYAYGLDARRLNISNRTEKKGNHEIMFYILAAF